MTLMLYVGSRRYSSWSLRPYVALVHSGIPFEVTTILLDRETTKAEIAQVNPAGKVPVLHHDGLVIWDSLAICEYLHELAPAAELWPADRAAPARARAQRGDALRVRGAAQPHGDGRARRSPRRGPHPRGARRRAPRDRDLARGA